MSLDMELYLSHGCIQHLAKSLIPCSRKPDALIIMLTTGKQIDLVVRSPPTNRKVGRLNLNRPGGRTFEQR